MGAEKKRKKTKIIPRTQPKARAGWPKRLRLVQATPWADFAILDVQLCSTITAIFPLVDNLFSTIIHDLDSRITAKYSKCQTSFYSMQVSFGFHSLRCSEILVSPSICTKIRTWRFYRTEEVSNNFSVSCSGVRSLKELWERNGNSHSDNSDTVMGTGREPGIILWKKNCQKKIWGLLASRRRCLRGFGQIFWVFWSPKNKHFLWTNNSKI